MSESDRLKLIIRHLIGKGLASNQKGIGELLGYKNESSFSQVVNGKVPTPSNLFKKLKNLDNQINEEWLVTGEGEMLKKPQIESNAVLVQNPEMMMVPLISKYAYAGYLAGYGDDEYMEALPTIPFIIPEGQTHRGEYVAVEVKGDSMDDGSVESIMEGDVILCRNIDRLLWTNYKLHLRKWNFAIVHKEGIIIKRIIAHNVEAGTITIHSLNPDYRDKVIDLNDVVKIMNVVQLQRKPMI